ncbi:hypothetical protein BS50DRAFT_625762 [Corynespora cassiicola Philippines]|uniref:Uncharacterized protein n=1 Tax=Corynespora cassiicola Philippines TaxID=1448308 RepID=A0A2T2N5Q0_CORCC|nr:hypothetical protein BS50DRAFT_625762 [Corynespora cassiicola Philippines]
MFKPIRIHLSIRSRFLMIQPPSTQPHLQPPSSPGHIRTISLSPSSTSAQNPLYWPPRPPRDMTTSLTLLQWHTLCTFDPCSPRTLESQLSEGKAESGAGGGGASGDGGGGATRPNTTEMSEATGEEKGST